MAVPERQIREIEEALGLEQPLKQIPHIWERVDQPQNIESDDQELVVDDMDRELL